MEPTGNGGEARAMAVGSEQDIDLRGMTLLAWMDRAAPAPQSAAGPVRPVVANLRAAPPADHALVTQADRARWTSADSLVKTGRHC